MIETILGYFHQFGSYFIPFLIVLGIVVFVHEWGHFWMARRNGVKVEVFSIGFGPELWHRFDKKGTRWRLGLFPIGGYVKMFGDADPASLGSDEEIPADQKHLAFHHKRLPQKAWIVAAGPLANYVLAIVILTVLYVVAGQPFTAPIVNEIIPDSAAAAAGLQPDDKITAINGESIQRFEDIQRYVQLHLEEELTLAVQRGEEMVNITLTPRILEQEDHLGNAKKTPLIGIRSHTTEVMKHDPAMAGVYAVKEVWAITTDTLKALGQIVSGVRGKEELGGPLRIAQLSGDVAQTGVISFVMFIAILSVNLGLINLFPIPILDGGHLLFFALEGLRRKPLSLRAQELFSMAGFSALIALMLFATWNDLVQLRVIQTIKDFLG